METLKYTCLQLKCFSQDLGCVYLVYVKITNLRGVIFNQNHAQGSE